MKKHLCLPTIRHLLSLTKLELKLATIIPEVFFAGLLKDDSRRKKNAWLPAWHQVKHFFSKKIITYLILFKQYYQKAYAILTHVARVDFDWWLIVWNWKERKQFINLSFILFFYSVWRNCFKTFILLLC